MPRKPRQTRIMRPAPLSPAWRAFFETGARGQGEDAVEIFMASGSRTKLAAAWEIYRDEFMVPWVKDHPGTRPWAWWEVDGPRHDTGTGAFFEPLPIPRQQIGGQGIITSEKWQAVVPTFEKGIPEFYEIDEEDPPCFESESAYLSRHSLLSEHEKKYLQKHLELMEPEKIIFEEEEPVSDD